MGQLIGGVESGVTQRSLRWRAFAGGLVVFAMLAASGVASAASFHVTGTGDSVAPCSGTSCPSLRSAVLASNAAGGTNSITVPAGQYTLTRTPSGPDNGSTGDLHITANVTITGAGAGPAGTRLVGDGDRIFDISAAAVTLARLSLSGGSHQKFGGAISVTSPAAASLTLVSDLLHGNTTTSSGFGGAVYMAPSGAGTLTVANTVFTANIAAETGASQGGFGGAISFEPGGAPSTRSTLTVRSSTFTFNAAQSGTNGGGGFGGAIDFEPSNQATLTITGSTFASNVAAGSKNQGGFGGGVEFEPGTAASQLNITNSTFNGNQAGGKSGFGGGISFEPGTGSSATLTHVTIAGNSATNAAGGGGLEVADSPATVRNSIISGNTAGGATNNCVGGSLVIPQGHNVELGTTCHFDKNANPLLAPLHNNGGPTPTMAIAPNSPARDAALPAFCPSTDQRGVHRPDDAGTPCDIGAYEFRTPPPHGTRITKTTINQKKHTAKFAFTALGKITGFQCALIKNRHPTPKPRFSRCSSPKTYKNLKAGSYIFEVRAFNSAGHDPRPATKKFKIK